MARNNNFLDDFEYDENEYRAKKSQNRRPPNQQRPVNGQPRPVAKNPNAQNQYRNLKRKQQNNNLSYDAKPYYSNQGPRYQEDYPDRPDRPIRNAGNNHSNAPHSSSDRPKQKTSFGKIVKRILLVIFALYIALTGYLYSVITHVTYNREDRGRNQYVSSSSLKKDFFVENILFIGVDSRGEENSRSDTMMLVSIDKKNRKIKLTSFLRDTYVTVPDHGDMKLNAACFYGGPKLVMDTIEYNFGIDIDHYVLVDFEAFKGVINGIGGVDVDITDAEAVYLRDTVKIDYIKSGHNHLNGGAALWYCRIRYLDNDFNRTQRQRKVISSIVSAASKTNPFKLIKTVNDVLPYVETDMTAFKLTFLSEATGLFYLHFDIEQQQVPLEGQWSDQMINGQACLVVDKESTKQQIIDYIYE